MKEYELYRSVYCGLCKQLGRCFGPFARMTLSYDFAFLSLLHLSVNHKQAQLKKQCCFYNPLVKKSCCQENLSLDFSAATAMIILYHKVNDNISDSTGFKKFAYVLLKPFSKGAYKKAKKQYPELAEVIDTCMLQQQELEKDASCGIDRSAEPTAKALSGVFALISDHAEQKRVLERLGYFLGRWVYLMDALDDLEEDLNNHTYNPFLLKYNIKTADEQKLQEIKEYALGSLNLTLGEIANAYVLLDLNLYEPILKNIIYMGLPFTQRQVLWKKEKTENE